MDEHLRDAALIYTCCGAHPLLPRAQAGCWAWALGTQMSDPPSAEPSELCSHLVPTHREPGHGGSTCKVPPAPSGCASIKREQV